VPTAPMEPSPGADPGNASIPRTRGRQSEGHELAGLDSNQRRTEVQSLVAPASRATGQCEPPAGLEPAACRLQGGRSSLVSYRGIAYARRDSNPQQHGPQPCPSTRLRHERIRAATRCRTGPFAVRRRSRKPCAAARLAILASNQETPDPESGGSAKFP
jgi:hypothetical protein